MRVGVNMSKFLLTTVCLLGLLLSSASAQEGEEEFKAWKEKLVKRDITRYVPSGKTRPLWFLVGAYADCSPFTDIEARTTKKPEHGTVEIVSDVKAPRQLRKGQSRVAHCNDKKTAWSYCHI